MKMSVNRVLSLGLISSTIMGGAQAMAVTIPFTETFNTNASGWVNGNASPGAVTYNATGGIGNTGYISQALSFTSPAGGSFGAPPLQLFFRGNAADDASGDAFVGNWLTAGVSSFSVSHPHNYTSNLDFYARIAGSAGAGASVATGYAIAPNTWTTITIPITNSNPPFLSFGSGTFSSAFSGVQNLQIGLYVPANTTFTDLTLDLDNVSAVPEPATFGLIAMGALASLKRVRRPRA